MEPEQILPSQPISPRPLVDENSELTDFEPLPIRGQVNILRYRTIKKSAGFGWWSAVVVIEDHNKKQVCFYRWKKQGSEWKQDKKLSFHSHKDWRIFKEGVEYFLKEME